MRPKNVAADTLKTNFSDAFAFSYLDGNRRQLVGAKYGSLKFLTRVAAVVGDADVETI